MRTNKRWTAAEDAVLRKRYPTEGASLELMETLQRDAVTLRYRASRLKIPFGCCHDWTEEEMSVLKKRYPVEGASEDLQVLLNRHPRLAIRAKAQRLGLRVSEEAKVAAQKRTHPLGERNQLFGGYGRVRGNYIAMTRKGARNRGLAYPLLDGSLSNMKYLDSLLTPTCPLSGLSLTTPTHAFDWDATASLDRIDSSKGYVRGNVRWVHKIVNQIKWDFTDAELAAWARDVTQFFKS